MQIEQVKSGLFQFRHVADKVPDCPTCGERCKSPSVIASMLGVTYGLVWSWSNKRGLKGHEGEFKEGKRQGTRGVTPLYYCVHEVNMWLVANPKRLRGKTPASWTVVRNFDGSEVKAPTHISPLHLTSDTYGEFSIDLIAKLNEGLV